MNDLVSYECDKCRERVQTDAPCDGWPHIGCAGRDGRFRPVNVAPAAAAVAEPVVGMRYRSTMSDVEYQVTAVAANTYTSKDVSTGRSLRGGFDCDEFTTLVNRGTFVITHDPRKPTPAPSQAAAVLTAEIDAGMKAIQRDMSERLFGVDRSKGGTEIVADLKPTDAPLRARLLAAEERAMLLADECGTLRGQLDEALRARDAAEAEVLRMQRGRGKR